MPPLEAVRTEKQEVMSSVMRRVVIGCVAPCLSAAESNPLIGELPEGKLEALITVHAREIRSHLSRLSKGEEGIFDFSTFIDATLGEEKDLSGIIADLKNRVDSIADAVRNYLHGDLKEEELDQLLPGLKERIDEAKRLYARVNSKLTKAGPTKRPLKDDPIYGGIFRDFLAKERRGMNCPNAKELFELLASLPMGEGLYSVEIGERLGLDRQDVYTLIQALRNAQLIDSVPLSSGFVIEGRRIPKKDKGRKKYCLAYYGCN